MKGDEDLHLSAIFRMKEQYTWLGRPVSALPKDDDTPIEMTAAPGKTGEARRDGTPRLIGYRDGHWVAARFMDGLPKRKTE